MSTPTSNERLLVYLMFETLHRMYEGDLKAVTRSQLVASVNLNLEAHGFRSESSGAWSRKLVQSPDMKVAEIDAALRETANKLKSVPETDGTQKLEDAEFVQVSSVFVRMDLTDVTDQVKVRLRENLRVTVMGHPVAVIGKGVVGVLVRDSCNTDDFVSIRFSGCGFRVWLPTSLLEGVEVEQSANGTS